MKNIEHNVNFIDDDCNAAETLLKIQDDVVRFTNGEISSIVINNITPEDDSDGARIMRPVLLCSMADQLLQKSADEYNAVVDEINKYIAENGGDNMEIGNAVEIIDEIHAVREELDRVWSLMPKLAKYEPGSFKFHTMGMNLQSAFLELGKQLILFQKHLMELKNVSVGLSPTNINHAVDDSVVSAMSKNTKTVH